MPLLHQTIFAAGREGYHTYRIPALLVTRAGTLLAFCEGRVHDRGDHGEIQLLVNRSADNGRTWSPHQVVWRDGPNTCGNPCPVQDRATGTIWLLANENPPGRRSQDYFNAFDGRSVAVLASADDGQTWSAPRDITAAVKRPNWGWYATGPCTGIELRHGPHQGRLVIPCNHSEFDRDPVGLFAHVIYSDDRGQSWQLGGTVPTEGYDECQAVELDDGRLLLNMRHYHPTQHCRGTSTSRDGGLSWSPARLEPALVEDADSGCQGSLIRAADGTLLFANPAALTRDRMTIRRSADAGATWSVLAVLHDGPAAYSSLALLSDGRVGCLFECGDRHPYERLVFAALDCRAPQRLGQRG